MTFKESAEKAAKNPWGQWAAVIIAIAGCVAAYIDLQTTKARLEIKHEAAEEVESTADKRLAESVQSNQVGLEEVWKYCQEVNKQTRRHAEKQDQAILVQRYVLRRLAYGMDDVRYTIQSLHPQRPAANFEREDMFTDATDDLESDYDSIEDDPDVALPKVAKKDGLRLKRVDPYKINRVREAKKNEMQQIAE